MPALITDSDASLSSDSGSSGQSDSCSSSDASSDASSDDSADRRASLVVLGSTTSRVGGRPVAASGSQSRPIHHHSRLVTRDLLVFMRFKQREACLRFCAAGTLCKN
jgi:hypothetical protein